MKNKSYVENIANVIGILSLIMSIAIFLLILNWFFKITPFQRLEGFPLLITPFTSPVGFILGVISVKIYDNNFGKYAIATNVILFILPFVYWFLGTLTWGP